MRRHRFSFAVGCEKETRGLSWLWGLSSGGRLGLEVWHPLGCRGPLKPGGRLSSSVHHRQGGLETAEIYFSHFCRLEVGGQGASMVRLCVW